MNCFDALPISAVVNNRFFCCHGGLSPELESISQIHEIDRFQEVPTSGLMCDLLWADPHEDESADGREVSFIHNATRGCSFFYGYAAVSKFLEKNKLISILRAHEAQLDGYKMHCKRKNTDFPTVITLFSAPNYCDTYANKGAVLKYHNNLMNIRQFHCSPHPYYLPNFINVFQWSLPFVADKITEFCDSIIESVAHEDDLKPLPLVQGELNVDPSVTASNAEVIRNKIRSAAKFAVMLKSLRENSEDILKIKKEMPDNRIPPGLLQKGTAEIKRVRDSFDRARRIDKLNEKRPSVEDILKKKKNLQNKTAKKGLKK
eukprot:c20888_g3_i1.p1 GENE.c20888_g3_i1~~c20888_g3_i1.p1  ORF type:complete len:317 (-),score=77.53 c20888_g3_i1:74-1024(-)